MCEEVSGASSQILSGTWHPNLIGWGSSCEHERPFCVCLRSVRLSTSVIGEAWITFLNEVLKVVHTQRERKEEESNPDLIGHGHFTEKKTSSITHVLRSVELGFKAVIVLCCSGFALTGNYTPKKCGKEAVFCFFFRFSFVKIKEKEHQTKHSKWLRSAHSNWAYHNKYEYIILY